jgi:hypothetical protein
MRSRLRRRAVFCAVTVVVTSALACGSRTDLDFDFSSMQDDAASPHDDGAPMVDAITPPPTIDATPPNDASVCPKNGTTAFMLSDDARLFTLDPPTLTTHLLGTLDCSTSAHPWSLTASSSGAVYVIYDDWNIHEIDPKTLACHTTPYAPDQLGLSQGETGITIAPTPSGERLYVYGQDRFNNSELDVGDLTTFVLSNVGTVTPPPVASSHPLDIRADAFGRIFGFGPDSTLVQIDRDTAALVAQVQTSFAPMGGASWALLTWNADLYLFSEGDVGRYDLATQIVTRIGNVGVTVVGASAAPCIH